MWISGKAVVAMTLASALSACGYSHGPGGVAYSRDDSPAVGATGGAAEGSVSHTLTEPAKTQRGNTPPGMDRDGHGPAAGAILDPTGAATRGSPY